MAETRAKEVDAAKKKKTRQKRLKDLELTDIPFVALGRAGESFVYFVRKTKRLERLTISNHKARNLLLLADSSFWYKVDNGAGATSLRSYEYCVALHGGAEFNPERVRNVGMWDEDGRVLYNAGNACYAVENGEIVPVDNTRPDGRIYTAGNALPEPGLEMMTDEQGKAFADFLNAYPWREERGGDLFAGLVVQALLSGFVPLRVHGWITAPAGSGKSMMLDRIDQLTGGLFCCMKGSSEAGVRQRINETALPVGYDEAETDPGEKSGDNMKKIMEMGRASTDGGVLWMGGPQGKPLLYIINSAFLFFSVNSALNKAANESRFMHLNLMPTEDKTPMDTAFTKAMNAVTPGALIARLMHVAPVLLQNIEALKTSLNQNRRGKIFSVVLACRHALTSRELMTPDQLAEAAALVEASTVAKVETDDSSRCLDAIMQYRPQGLGRDTDLQGLLYAERTRQTGVEAATGEYGVKMVTRNGNEGIFVQHTHTIITKALFGSEWQAGCRDALLNLQGAESCKQKIRTGHNSVSGIWIPAYHVFDIR